MSDMTIEKAVENYMGGIDCSQVCFGHGAEVLGFDKETAVKIAAAFGGGMFAGERCGCVTGSLMALGLKYGHYKKGDEDAKNAFLAKKAEFEAKFKEAHETLMCKELIGYDVSKPEELQAALESGVMFDLCPKLAVTACEILDDML